MRVSKILFAHYLISEMDGMTNVNTDLALEMVV